MNFNIMIYPIYIKLTNRCNLKCMHCYNANAIQQCKDMSDDTFSDLIRYLNNRYLQLATGDCILVIFHGGEPFIADLNKMQILIDQFSSCENISFTATTNLIYDLDDVKICIMKKMKQISTSYDYKIRFTTLSQQ